MATGESDDSWRLVYVIADPCIGVKDLTCTSVCPPNCIHPGRGESRFPAVLQLFIDPHECIGCARCVSVCPVGAIFERTLLPEKWRQAAAVNARFFEAGSY